MVSEYHGQKFWVKQVDPKMLAADFMLARNLAVYGVGGLLAESGVVPASRGPLAAAIAAPTASSAPCSAAAPSATPTGAARRGSTPPTPSGW